MLCAHALRVQSLAHQLRPLLASIGEYDHQIQTLFAAHPDSAIFASFPGAGSCLAPRLLAAFGTNRDRFAEADAMQRLSGVAPVTRRSGKFHAVGRRHACSKFLSCWHCSSAPLERTDTSVQTRSPVRLYKFNPLYRSQFSPR